MTSVGVLHPGAMGAAVGAALRAAGHEVLWASEGRSPQTAERAHRAGLADAVSTDALFARCEVVLSVCPPHAALAVARSAAGFRGVYVDANAISPGSARAAEAILLKGGARFVDGGIIGPPPATAGTSRLYLSGGEAAAIARLFAGATLEPIVVAGEVGAASAVKAAYAAWTKGTAALLLAIVATARAHGVEEALRAEWSRSQPDLAERAGRAERSAAEKGWRWEGEMREIAATFAEAAMPEGFHLAAAEVFASRTPDAGRSSS